MNRTNYEIGETRYDKKFAETNISRKANMSFDEWNVRKGSE